jgi:diguanylate cyclase (GGDEF)-like protein
MISSPENSMEERLQIVKAHWGKYTAGGEFEQFVEFALAINSLTAYFNRMHLAGLVRLSEGLENLALSNMGDQSTHPLEKQDIACLQRQLDTLMGSVETSRMPNQERRAEPVSPILDGWIKPRSVWMIAAPGRLEAVKDFNYELSFYGFKIFEMEWGDEPPADVPLAVLFAPEEKNIKADEFAYISTVRAACPTSQLFCLNVEPAMDRIVTLIRAGIDVTIPVDENSSVILDRIIDLVQTKDHEKSRVLIIEDSQVAVTMIKRTLAQHDIDTMSINDPAKLFEALDSYRPDLILTDMHMPNYNGIEATRVLRQMPDYSSLPIVYLSAESEVGMQVEALRLGGDQFLIKPFNPVLLAAVVQTKIERYRETQRSSHIDGLTGLLNHTAAKSRLKSMVAKAAKMSSLTAAMIDIDLFKSINDTYGHPVGDQVIRGLAWLLKGRLRSTDLIGRYGGEEFLIALQDISHDDAFHVIDRIRSDFATLPHSHPKGVLHATFSAGVANYPEVRTADALTEAADAAMLQAKRLGRNRVERAIS